MFAKNKKKEAEQRKLRFIESTLRSFLKDFEDLENIRKGLDMESNENYEKNINKMIEYRAREILEWT